MYQYSNELIFEGEHIRLKDLITNDRTRDNTYLQKGNIPPYPTPVEFHSTEVIHVTSKTSIQNIWESRGFKGFDYSDRNKNLLSWWSLKINEEKIREAEQRYLESEFPNRSQEQIAEQQPFLSEFTTSPSFRNDISRYGNFQFTIPLNELMESYKREICDGRDPILRVYQTKVYKQVIVYVVLVHSPQMNEKFQRYPELTSSSLVAYEPGKIIWRAQAICETHSNTLIMENQRATSQPYGYNPPFYVWDNVSLAFHLAEGKVLPFHNTKLDYCEIEKKRNGDELNLSGKPNCKYDEAMEVLKKFFGMQFKEVKKEEDQYES